MIVPIISRTPLRAFSSPRALSRDGNDGGELRRRAWVASRAGSGCEARVPYEVDRNVKQVRRPASDVHLTRELAVCARRKWVYMAVRWYQGPHRERTAPAPRGHG